MKTLAIIIGAFAVSFLLGAIVWCGTATFLDPETANRLPGGAFCSGCTCGFSLAVVLRRFWIIPITIVGAICGHVAMIYLYLNS